MEKAKLIRAIDAAEMVADEFGIALDELVDAFQEIEPVNIGKTARWTDCWKYGFGCSECSYVQRTRSRFCPVCGARMEVFDA